MELLVGIVSYSLTAILIGICGAAIIEAKVGLELKFIHGLLAPLGSLVVILGFLNGLLQAKRESYVTWRGRNYSVKDHILKIQSEYSRPCT